MKENNFFISDLSEEKKEKIRSISVDFVNMEIDETKGIVVGPESIYAVLESIGADIDSESETSVEGILRVSLKDAPAPSEDLKPKIPESKVMVESWNGEWRKKFVEVAEEMLLPYLKRNIIFRVPHKEVVEPIVDGNFRILIWSSPKKKERLSEPPSKMWGIPVDCTDKSFHPSGLGIPIVDKETEWAVAELLDDSLYIHHDICHHGSNREIEIFRKVCKEVVDLLDMSPEEIEELEKELLLKSYIREHSRQIERSIREKREEVEEGHSRIKDLQKKLTYHVRKTQEAEKDLGLFLIGREEEIKRSEKEFKSLTNINGVEKVKIKEGVIKVFTEHIYIIPDGHDDVFDIGKFRMEILTDEGRVKFFNLTRKGSGGSYHIHHPHVEENGSPCLGNISELVPELVGSYQYSAVAQLGIQFLKSVNLNDSAGEDIFMHWPKVEEKKAKKGILSSLLK